MGLVAHIVDRDAAGALADLDAAVQAGVDAGATGRTVVRLLSRLHGGLGRLPGRDIPLRLAGRRRRDIAAAGQRLGLQTVLAVMQILDQTLSRMRYSTQGRILAELALVRICHLEDLEELSQIIAQIRGGLPITVVSSAGHRSAVGFPIYAAHCRISFSGVTTSVGARHRQARLEKKTMNRA